MTLEKQFHANNHYVENTRKSLVFPIQAKIKVSLLESCNRLLSRKLPKRGHN